MNNFTISFGVLCALVGATLLWANPFSTDANDQFAGTFTPPDQRIPMEQIDHSDWTRLLKRYVNDDGQVDYAAWHGNKTDRTALKSYLAKLSRAEGDAQASREAKLAYWINAYNAVTIEGILRVYPTTSIRNHTPRLVGYNIWNNLLLYSGDRKISLNDIEHEVLRKMGEPRIHFAIVCASIGCPRLLNEAYVAESLERQLTRNTTDFFSRKQNLIVDGPNKTLEISTLINWFGSDFGGSQAEQLAYLKPYLPADAQKLIDNGSALLPSRC